MSERVTVLYDRYKDYEKARFVDFFGWKMPVSFSPGIVGEHTAVRNHVGYFDVCHMGRYEISGTRAVEFVDYHFTNKVPGVTKRNVHYGFICREDGGCLDDVVVYRLDENRFMIVVNAGNREKIFQWFTKDSPWPHRGDGGVDIIDRSDDIAQIAVQGPSAHDVLNGPADNELPRIKFFRARQNVKIAGFDCTISRTGYTGEDGYELYCDADAAGALWDEIQDAGKEYGGTPCGLGARDTLRFEAALPLYGHELTEEIAPLESGLDMFVKLDKGDFCGRDALHEISENGPDRVRIGLEMTELGVPRAEFPVFQHGEPCGFVTSGSKCPTLDTFNAMALVRSQVDRNAEFHIDIRGSRKAAVECPLPFYSRR